MAYVEANELMPRERDRAVTQQHRLPFTATKKEPGRSNTAASHPSCLLNCCSDPVLR